MRAHPGHRKSRGQGQTEYVIIVALIAISTIGVVTLFGDNIRRLFGDSSESVAGEDSVANSNDVPASSDVTDKNMDNFAQNNAYDSSGAGRPGPPE